MTGSHNVVLQVTAVSFCIVIIILLAL
ncbi:LOW QUALITY PROTEIN: hypothetical protein TorRG33x02_230620 [Trema orientale]|uniref:Uncharacterized protein n=1 Tax=Trema orientale TaxID=63057 RepID=A0A2P5E6E2_TREOI|nr:LOW QUALITY PROTEIN: hypothetical protein TorRG33x02_230620 [Trema orientale]